MASADGDGGQDLTKPNAAPDKSDIEQGRVNESQPLLAGSVPEQEREQLQEKQRREQAQENQRKQLVETKRVADRNVLDDIEAELVVYDEKENLLAQKYLDEVRVRKDRERQVREKRLPNQSQGGPPLPEAPSGPPLPEAPSGPPLPEAPGGQPLPEAPSGPPLPEDRLFNEVKNLVYIDKSPILKKALEDWAKKEALLTSRVDRKTTRVAHLKNEVYQLIGFFSVFQGVVLTAVSQANLLHCNNKWSPILLSVLASIVTIAAIAQKLFQISSFQKTIHTDYIALTDVVHRGRELRSEGPRFVFAKYISANKEKEAEKNYFWIYSGVVLGFLVVFTVVFPVSYWRILCYPDPSPCSTSPPPA